MSKKKPTVRTRKAGRKPNQLRPLTIERDYPSNAAGSVMIDAGQTRILVTASISDKTPPWLLDRETGQPKSGWVTAEYNMLPGSTPDRKKRGQDSRSTEIQRLIARSLRAAVDLDKMPGLMITCDCEVIRADGGTRTAAITAGYVALVDALSRARDDGKLEGKPVIGPVAAVSVGIIDGVCYLDLDYPLDSRAEVDMNVVMDHKGRFIEVQGTAEGQPFDRGRLDELLDLATGGCKKLIAAQCKALRG